MTAPDPVTAYRLGRRVANVALGAWVLLSLASLCALVVMFAGCSWRPALNPERPGVTWTTTERDVLDAHAETMFPVAYAACLERKECR